MSNYKEINWDKIRGDYVLGTDYPSFDELSKRYNISKPLLIAKANDISDPINKGKTWIEQRQSHIDRKQQIQEDVAITEAKAAVKTFVKVLNNIGLKAFKVINRQLDQIDKDQQEAINNNKPFNLNKHVKISDITKIVEVLHKISGAEGSHEMLLKLEIIGQQKKNLQDLSDEDLQEIDYQVSHGGVKMIDVDLETTENGST